MKCPHCEEYFLGSRILKMHLMKTHPEKPIEPPITFNCTKCGRKLLTQWGLNKHMETMHPAISHEVNDPVDCQLCDATLKNQWYYKNHLVKRHHLQCPFCHMEFRERFKCIRHIRGYDDGPECPFCGIKLPSRTCCREHVEKLHNPSSSDQLKFFGKY